MIISHVRSFHQKDNYCILLMVLIPWMSDWFDEIKNLICVGPLIFIENKNVACILQASKRKPQEI